MELRYPAIECRITWTSLQPAPVYMVASADDALSAGIAAAHLAAALRHQQDDLAVGEGGTLPHLVCCLFTGDGGPTPAARAAMEVLQQRLYGLSTTAAAAGVAGHLDSKHVESEWRAANVILLDVQLGQEEVARRQLEDAGLMHLLWLRFWQGCHLVGLAGGCSLLGRGPCTDGGSDGGPEATILPWYLVRPCSTRGHWDKLQADVASSPAGAVGVALLGGSSCTVDAVTGAAGMLTAPTSEMLGGAFLWEVKDQLQEAGEQYGFIAAVAKGALEYYATVQTQAEEMERRKVSKD